MNRSKNSLLTARSSVAAAAGCEFDMRDAEIGRVALQRGDPRQRVGVGRLAEQQRQQAVFRGAQLIDLVDFGISMSPDASDDP